MFTFCKQGQRIAVQGLVDAFGCARLHRRCIRCAEILGSLWPQASTDGTERQDGRKTPLESDEERKTVRIEPSSPDLRFCKMGTGRGERKPGCLK